MMTPGNVTIADDGTATFTPNDGTNCAKALYDQMIGDDGANPDMTPKTTVASAVACFVHDFTMPGATSIAMTSALVASPATNPPPPPHTVVVIPNGTAIPFGAVTATLTADAWNGDQTLSVAPLSGAIASGTHGLVHATATTTKVPVPAGPNNDADKKKAFAKLANTMAAWMVAYLQANAVAVIPATSAGDGLQNGTTHPTTQKTIAIQ